MSDSATSLAELWPRLLALALAALVVMGSPGPSTMSVTAMGAAFGLRRSLAYATGAALGTFAVLLGVATGLLTVLATWPWLPPLLLAASALYILYLAVRIATAPPLSDPANRTDAPSFAGGFLLGIGNPKAYLAIGAVYAGAALPGLAAPQEALIKIVVLGAMIAAIHAGWLVMGASLARLLRDPAVSRAVNLIFAAMLIVATALTLI